MAEETESAMDEFVDFFGDEAGEVLGRVLDERAPKSAAPPAPTEPVDERQAAIAASEAEEDAVLDRIVGPVEGDDEDDGLADIDVSEDAAFDALERGDHEQLQRIKRAADYQRDESFYNDLDGKVGVP